MNQQDTQERLLNEIPQLVTAVDRLVNALNASNGVTNCSSEDDMLPQAIDNLPSGTIDDLSPQGIDDISLSGGEKVALASSRALQEIQLGYEIDRCSGSLTVRDKNNQWIFVPRGQWTTVDVAIDGNGYWYWRCGSSSEKSRGGPNFRQRVKRLKIWHSMNDRKITWWCYDLL